MKIGTKSVLFGAHCFLIHPFFVAAAWWKLYGFPWDPRLWVAFFVHDLGYLGKPNMDGPEGERHPEWGAWVMRRLFDEDRCDGCATFSSISPYLMHGVPEGPREGRYPCTKSLAWYHFVLYHSRYYSKAQGAQPSRLCFADKLAFALTPWWLYLPLATLTGEINEYLERAQKADSAHWKPTGYDKRRWHQQLCDYMVAWVAEHKDGAQDTWTSADRHALTDSGVTR